MKYIVVIDLINFEFDNGTTAMSFAELAKEHVEHDTVVKVLLEKDNGHTKQER